MLARQLLNRMVVAVLVCVAVVLVDFLASEVLNWQQRDILRVFLDGTF